MITDLKPAPKSKNKPLQEATSPTSYAYIILLVITKARSLKQCKLD